MPPTCLQVQGDAPPPPPEKLPSIAASSLVLSMATVTFIIHLTGQLGFTDDDDLLVMITCM